MIISKKLIVKFSTYSIVGVVSVAFYFLSIFFFVEVFHQEPVLSSALAFILMTLLSYVLNKKFTFNSASSKKAFLKYLAVSGIAFVLNSSIMYAVVYIFSYHYFIGEIVTTLVIPVINFILNNYWTFKEND